MATISAIPSTKISGGSFLLEERKVDEVFTPEDFTEQHQLIGQTAEEFAVNEILPNAEKMEHKDFSVTRDLLKKAGDLGLSGVEIPEAYGGLEMDKVTAAVIADDIAKYAGFATTWGAHSGIGLLPIVYFGTEQQKQKYLPGIASGAHEFGFAGVDGNEHGRFGAQSFDDRDHALVERVRQHLVLQARTGGPAELVISGERGVVCDARNVARLVRDPRPRGQPGVPRQPDLDDRSRDPPDRDRRVVRR